ncbi:MAG: hypothetical protein IDH49_00195 [Gammaproteobacteria bacterium]|nr:hypothetical protein [Gammaproteobacteria bacterium]
MRHLKKAIDQLESQIDENKRRACGQARSAQRIFYHKIATPKAVIVTFAAAVLVGFLGKKCAQGGDKSESAQTAECGAHDWLGKVDAVLRLMPLISNVRACCGAAMQERK